MKVHANAPLGPKGRLTMVRRVVEEGWSLAEAAAAAGVSERTCSQVGRSVSRRGRGRAAGSLVGAAVDPASHAGRARRGDRGAAAAADDRRGDRVLSGDGALDRLGGAGRGSGWASSAGSSRPSRPIATSAATPASWSTSTSKSSGGSTGEPATASPASASSQRSPRTAGASDRRLGVRARLRRRRHPPGLRRGPRRREGHHRGRASCAARSRSTAATASPSSA